MSKYEWVNNLASDLHLSKEELENHLQYNYQEWCIANFENTHRLFIIQPKKDIEHYELWKGCYNGEGDRYPSKNYKCLAEFTSLDAAKVAYILHWKSQP